jgi:hypothetical protein
MILIKLSSTKTQPPSSRGLGHLFFMEVTGIEFPGGINKVNKILT